VVVLASAVPALCGDLALPVESVRPPLLNPRPVSQWEVEVGGRYWFSSGRMRKDVFGFTGVSDNVFLSRLTWTGLSAWSPEIFGRVDHLSGFFVKGFVGGGDITTGNLQDEDFPPVTVPYSSTNSEQHDGRLAYAVIDAGWGWRSREYRFGFFGGYQYQREKVNGFGCVQTAANPFICAPTIPSSVLAITQVTTWNAVRLGFNAEWRYGNWIADADVAWLPFAWLTADDTHWLRPFNAPESGVSVSNWQVEGLVRYRFANGFSLGAGGRYWRIDSSFAQTTPNVIGIPQTIGVVSERWGGFVQASYKFGELPALRY